MNIEEYEREIEKQNDISNPESAAGSSNIDTVPIPDQPNQNSCVNQPLPSRAAKVLSRRSTIATSNNYAMHSNAGGISVRRPTNDENTFDNIQPQRNKRVRTKFEPFNFSEKVCTVCKRKSRINASVASYITGEFVCSTK